MAEVSNELIYEVLKHVQTDLAQVKADTRDLKLRMTLVEEGMAGMHRRLDRIDDRLERLEKRVGLVEP